MAHMQWSRETWEARRPEKLTLRRERMAIMIPSMGRADRVRTLSVWPKEWRPYTYLVIPEAEAEEYRKHWPGIKQLIVPEGAATGIAETRQYIWECAVDVAFVCQVSDDLTFAWRDKELKLHRCTELRVCEMFDDIHALLVAGWMHVGVSARAGNSFWKGDLQVGKRMCDVYAHRHREAMALGVRWDRKLLMSDFDVTLQLCKLGHPNVVKYDYCHDQPASNDVGGCSTYRNPKVLAEEARLLRAFHPSFVSTVERKAKNWRKFPDVRVDVRVQWQKCISSWGLRPGKPAENVPGLQPEGSMRPLYPRKKKLLKKRVLKKKLLKKKVIRKKVAKKTIRRKG